MVLLTPLAIGIRHRVFGSMIFFHTLAVCYSTRHAGAGTPTEHRP